MPRLPGNRALVDAAGRVLHSLREINILSPEERERFYVGILPPRLFAYLGISPQTLCGADGLRCIKVIAPEGLGIVRIEVKAHPADPDTAFFLELADTHYGQMELSFCIIADPEAPRYYVDKDAAGRDNCFTTLGRNIPEELRAMEAGLFPNQTRRGLHLFGEFFPIFERFVDSLGMEMIVAEPLTYDNAIRYEKYGFDYITGKRLMLEIDQEFRRGGMLFGRLDGSNPFRMPGAERTVRGRSWAIHDGIMDEPWDEVRIYKTVGEHAGIDTFPDRNNEGGHP
ncbi:hypothetical protein KI811_04430 [Geobacter hydrogenophilus]|uniref:Uncharacterized protein n=1 Tax=Geobacter hydrogenophilus TaxID=40983 RepID=A0A9W6G1F9_9BACT|nr:hypothetical protein [Geobacter hydrogenophilus]MBT0893066.1 hypothetical protein [Geobacter hydrogenophilus]GLI39095.1 hypothetical protein GHYDROH2_25960 [Geobacter hydrogenophilus]